MAAHAQHPLKQAESQGRGQITYPGLSCQSTGQMVMGHLAPVTFELE